MCVTCGSRALALTCVGVQKTCVLMPCLHMCLCEACAETIMAGKRECPMCRKVTERVMRVFY